MLHHPIDTDYSVQDMDLDLLNDIVQHADKYDCLKAVKTPLFYDWIQHLSASKEIEDHVKLANLGLVVDEPRIFNQAGEFLAMHWEKGIMLRKT